MTNLWSGRFDSAPDAAAFEFGASFRFDRRLFEDDVTGSLAWGRALAAAGVLSAAEARQIEDALTALLQQGRSDPAFVDGPDEDVHSFVERLLVERLGDAGRRLHTGRSRNEQVSLTCASTCGGASRSFSAPWPPSSRRSRRRPRRRPTR